MAHLQGEAATEAQHAGFQQPACCPRPDWHARAQHTVILHAVVLGIPQVPLSQLHAMGWRARCSQI